MAWIENPMHAYLRVYQERGGCYMWMATIRRQRGWPVVSVMKGYNPYTTPLAARKAGIRVLEDANLDIQNPHRNGRYVVQGAPMPDKVTGVVE